MHTLTRISNHFRAAFNKHWRVVQLSALTKRWEFLTKKRMVQIIDKVALTTSQPAGVVMFGELVFTEPPANPHQGDGVSSRHRENQGPNKKSRAATKVDSSV